MNKYNVKFNDVNQIVKFVQDAKSYSGDVELRSGSYFVDGKSLLGVMYLGIEREISMFINGEAEQSFLSKINYAMA